MRVVIVGGLSGLGSAITQEFNSAGHEVLILENEIAEQYPQAQAAKTAGLSMMFGDLNDESWWQELKLPGEIDVLVNANSAFFPESGLETIQYDNFKATYEACVNVAFLACKYLHAAMKKGSCIVNVLGALGHRTTNKDICFASANAALLSLTKGLALDLGRHGIRCNSVSVGWLDIMIEGWVRGNEHGAIKNDRLYEKLLKEYGTPDAVLKASNEWFSAMVPLGRLGTTKDVAKAVRFLCSEDANFITGTDLCVDGGTYAGTLRPQFE